MQKPLKQRDTGSDIIPVILAGGAGRRLWPLSRKRCPKPFIRFRGGASFFQRTLLRAAEYKAPVISCNQAQYELAAKQATAIGQSPQQVFLEPEARGTAAALAVVAHYFAGSGKGNEIFLILPTDHLISRPQALHDAVQKALPYVKRGNFVQIGVKAGKADTGLGYIRQGSNAGSGAFTVERFVEKPRPKDAASFIKEGHWLWSSGICLFTPDTLLAALKRLEPDFSNKTYQAVARARRRQEAVLLNEEAFQACPAASFDRMILQNVDNRIVITADMGWQDIGSWHRLIRNFRHI